MLQKGRQHAPSQPTTISISDKPRLCKPDALSSPNHLRPSSMSGTVSLAELREDENLESGQDTETTRQIRETEDAQLEKRELTEEMKCHSPRIDRLPSALLTWKCQAASFTHTQDTSN